jgi:type II secretory pathway component HofQ
VPTADGVSNSSHKGEKFVLESKNDKYFEKIEISTTNILRLREYFLASNVRSHQLRIRFRLIVLHQLQILTLQCENATLPHFLIIYRLYLNIQTFTSINTYSLLLVLNSKQRVKKKQPN